jgi:RNA polymerase sigma-70 factor, ECF subfamily
MITRTNEQWLEGLRHPDRQQQAETLADLHQVILTGLPNALHKWLTPADPRFAPLAEEVSQETVLRVLDRLDTFAGRSKFTTWVYTIAVRIALTELRRAKWREVSLDEIIESKDLDDAPREIPDRNADTEQTAEQNSLMTMLSEMMMESLTEKQRTAMVAVAINGMPLAEVAHRMNMERNALYKLLHDARLKLKKSLERQGMTPSDLLASFEQK